MGITKATSFCGGTSLRTGTIIIGTVDFVLALATGILTSMAAVDSDTYYFSEDYLEYFQDPMGDLLAMYIILAVFSYILMLTDCMLLFAVTSTQAKLKLFLPWIYYSYFSIVLNFICAMLYGIFSFTYFHDTRGYLSFSWAVFYPALKSYFILVVWSHYRQLLGGAGITHTLNGAQGTVYPTVPTGQQPLPNASQTYPNVQTQYPNAQMQYPNQPQPYPNVQAQQTFSNPQQPYPNPQQPYPNPQQPYPNPQQSYPNPQQPYSNPQQSYPNPQQSYPNPQQPYSNPQQSYSNPQQPYPNPQQLPSMESMGRDI